MILEQYFHKSKETKTANVWKKAMAAREVQKNSYRINGDVKQAKAFAAAVMTQIERPVQTFEEVEEQVVSVQPIVIFSQDMLRLSPAPALAL